MSKIELRAYTPQDGKTVVSWIGDERAFRMWCGDRFENYPLSADEFNKIYNAPTAIAGMIACDGGEAVGHFFVQPLGNGIYKLGLIIVDSQKRGKGYGKRMLESAIEYAKTNLNAKVLILYAFESNLAAYNCYKSLGFTETGGITEYEFLGEKHCYVELKLDF